MESLTATTTGGEQFPSSTVLATEKPPIPQPEITTQPFMSPDTLAFWVVAIVVPLGVILAAFLTYKTADVLGFATRRAFETLGDAEPDRPVANARVVSRGTLACLNCGTENERRYDYCGDCGRRLR